MPLGRDQQYDESWSEQEKIQRRMALKYRLKEECVRKKFDPFLQLKGELLVDPAIDRYMDLRKRGRTPGAPMKPQIFFTLVALVFVPIIGLTWAVNWERRDWEKSCEIGDLPYAKRRGKALV